ncbi:MAG: carbohydrate porin [Gemmataceae bacterium]
MSRKRLLSTALGLLAGLAEAKAQDAPALYPELRPAAAEAAPAGEPPPCLACEAPGHDLWTRPTLTGDWGGLRPRLVDQGITFNGSVTQFAFGLGGGINSPRIPPVLGQGDLFAYTGRGDYGLTVDLEKFGGMPHGKLHILAQHWWGQYGNVSLNTGSIPPAIFPAALPPVPNDQGVPMLTDFYITQPLSKEWVLFAGKKNVVGTADQDDFAGGNGTLQFMNQAFVANPAFLLALPYTGFTAGVISPREWGGFSAYVYDPQNRTKDFFRVDDLFSQGVIIGGEVKLKTNFFSLPGQQHVGGMWKHVELTNLAFNEPPPGQYPYQAVAGSPTLWDSYTIYYGFDQYVQTYSEDSKRGWGVFGRASISDGNPTPVRYFLSAGVGGYSPFRHREGDQFGIGWYYTGSSTQFGPVPQAVFGPRNGMGIEVFYNAKLTPWLQLTPDFQILRPEAGAIAETSYIGGVRLNVIF